MDDQDERIASVFDAEEIPEVSYETLKIYLQHIKDNISDRIDIRSRPPREVSNARRRAAGCPGNFASRDAAGHRAREHRLRG